MLSLNSKNTFLPSLVSKPRVGFDADYYKLFFRNTDIRTNVSVEYILNLEKKTINPGVVSYDLQEINKEYTMKYKVIPEGNLKEYNGEMKIFKNSINCRYFHYAGENYSSSHIDGYLGNLSVINIPEMHNLVNTLSAEILEFPNVTAPTIQITTPEYMRSFNIKDDRITSFNILSESFNLAENQFKDLINLKTVKLNYSPTSIPNGCFYNCSSLNFEDGFFKDVTTLGELSLYNTNLKTLRFAGDSTIGSGFAGVVFTSKSTINGLNEKSLFDTPVKEGVTGFVNLTDDAWCTESASDDAYVVPRGFNNDFITKEIYGCPAEPGEMVLECSDRNIIGFKFKTLDTYASEDIIGKGVHIPKYKIINNKKFFLLHEDILWNDNDEDHFVDASVVEVTAFDRNGYKSRVIRKRYDADDVPTFKTKLAFYTTTDNSTLKLNGEVFETNVPSNRIYIYGDLINIPKLEFSVQASGGSYWDFLVISTEQLNSTSNPNIKWIDVSDYLTMEALTEAKNNGLMSWPTYTNSLDDFTFYVYNRKLDGSSITISPGSSYISNNLTSAKTSFTL